MEDELLHLKKQHKIQLSDLEKSSVAQTAHLSETIKELKALKPDELKAQLDQAHADVTKMQSESQVEISPLFSVKFGWFGLFWGKFGLFSV